MVNLNSSAEADPVITAEITVRSRSFNGYSNGVIHMLINSLCEDDGAYCSPAPDERNKHLRGHNAAISCFVYPFGEDQRYDQKILVSGGADFAVIVWDIIKGALIHRFCSQAGPILRFLIPPNQCNTRVLNCVCSIAEDNSIALLSMVELKCILLASLQQNPIIDVKWRPKDDFMLLQCKDYSVYVWQLDSGSLDRVVTGMRALFIMEACKEGMDEDVEELHCHRSVSQKFLDFLF